MQSQIGSIKLSCILLLNRASAFSRTMETAGYEDAV